ncbi:MAG TPA: membrane dipeptidase [Actinomycetota bacterium]|nr:membrane dipeptidase [Actinomycetota bacterium]
MPIDQVVVDCHNDWLLLLERERSLDRTDSLGRRFLPQFRDAGINVQVSPIYIDHEFLPEGALRRTLLAIQHLKEEAAGLQEQAAVCLTGSDIDEAVEDGKVAFVIALEGSHAIANDVSLFDLLFELGVRMASFTHFGDTSLAGGSADGEPGKGLSRLGVEALRTFERLGIVMDVSHLSTQSTEDVLQRATRPVVASHSSSKAMRDHHRNLSVEHIKAIAALEGVIGIPAAIPSFIDPEVPTVNSVVDHIEHIATTVGVDAVGIGADFVREYFDEVYPTYEDIRIAGEDVRATIEGFDSPAGLPKLINALEARGFSDDDMRKILGGNFLRVFREVIGVSS